MKKSALRALHIASLFAGLALFIFLVRQTGLETLWHYLGMMGWGFAFILALSAVRNCARAASWYLSIDPRYRGIGYWPLMNVMLAGEAIKYLTATGPLVGEPAKAAMVKRQVPLLQGLSSVLVENLIYHLTVFVVMLAGLPALAWLVEVPAGVKLAGYLAGALIVAGIAGTWFAISRRSFVMARMLASLTRLIARSPFEVHATRLDSLAVHVRSVEENVYSFYRQRRGSFWLIFAVNMSAHLINVVEVCLILASMRVPATLSIGFVVEAVTKVINLVFFFVPTRAGVYESGHALVISALGMAASAGVALAIIRKLRAFVWVGYGLGVIMLMIIQDKRELKNEN